MISFKDYIKYYLRYINSLLGIREQEYDTMEISQVEKDVYNNYLNGTKLLLMISFIESNFLTAIKMKSLRKFESIDDIPSAVHQQHLSCFIYIRDCIAHNPNMLLLPSGTNTDNFISSTSEGNFNYASIDGEKIILNSNSIHYLHLIIRELYGKRT